MGHRQLKKPFFLALAAGLILPVGAGVVAPAAQAQFSDSYNFLKAVRDRKGDEAEKFLAAPGTVIINTRDNSTGETALHIVIQRRDASWLGYLLQKGANPNLADKKGTTPLMLATQLGFAQRTRKLFGVGDALSRAVAAADNGDSKLVEQGAIAFNIEQGRRVGDLQQQLRVMWVAEGDHMIGRVLQPFKRGASCFPIAAGGDCGG